MPLVWTCHFVRRLGETGAFLEVCHPCCLYGFRGKGVMGLRKSDYHNGGTQITRSEYRRLLSPMKHGEQGDFSHKDTKRHIRMDLSIHSIASNPNEIER